MTQVRPKPVHAPSLPWLRISFAAVYAGRNRPTFASDGYSLGRLKAIGMKRRSRRSAASGFVRDTLCRLSAGRNDMTASNVQQYSTTASDFRKLNHSLVLHLQRDVQIVVRLLLELERLVGRLEEREVGAVIEPVEGVQGLRGAPGLGLGELQRRDQGQAQELLVEAARLFRVPAAIGVVVQSFDHVSLDGSGEMGRS